MFRQPLLELRFPTASSRTLMRNVAISGCRVLVVVR